MSDQKPSFSWLDDFFGPAIVKLGAFFFTKRPVLEFIAGPGVQIDVADSPLNNATQVTIDSDFSPGGDLGSLQYYALDGGNPIFSGTKVLRNDDKSLNFKTSGNAFPRSGWEKGATTNATATTIATISIPAATYGDGIFTVYAESSYYFSSSGTQGGELAKKACFKRSSGALTRIGIVDLTSTGLSSGTSPGGLDIVTSGNDTIVVQATGIASTNITWLTSYHAKVTIP